MGKILTSQMVHYLLIKMTISQNDQSNGPYSTIQRTHPSHNGHVNQLVQNDKMAFLTLIKI
jgi:hypothetical protein